MPSYVDLGVLAVIFVSALLAMVRGFTREVLAIASWGAAALAALYLHKMLEPHLIGYPYMDKDNVRPLAAMGIIFLVTLILVSIITVKVSDLVLDSKIGALDRSLGFIFGAARGFLLCVIAFMFFQWLVQGKEPEMSKNARMRPVLIETGEKLVAMLPDMSFLNKLMKQRAPASSDEAPADAPDTPEPKPETKPAPAPQKRTDAPGVTPPRVNAGAATPASTAGDRKALDALVNRVGQQPAR